MITRDLGREAGLVVVASTGWMFHQSPLETGRVRFVPNFVVVRCAVCKCKARNTHTAPSLREKGKNWSFFIISFSVSVSVSISRKFQLKQRNSTFCVQVSLSKIFLHSVVRMVILIKTWAVVCKARRGRVLYCYVRVCVCVSARSGGEWIGSE